MATNPSIDIIRAILECDDDAMPGQKYQDPSIETRDDVRRPYYYIRPYVSELTIDGLKRQRKSIFLGFKDETPMRKAKAMKEQVMATVNAGKFVVQSQIPFGSIIKKYIDVGVPLLGPATRQKYEGHIKNHIHPSFSELRICDIDRMAVASWLKEKQAGGLSKWTLLDLRNILSAVFSFAEQMRLWTGENPCKGQKVGGAPPKEKTLPDRDGLLRFLAAIPETAIISADGARLIAITAVVVGCRVSEVLGLQPRDVDAKEETLRIDRSFGRGHEKPVKTVASRRKRQIQGLAAELLRYAEGRGPKDWIFQRNGDSVPPDDRDLQQHIFRPAAESAGVYEPGFGMHRFRHLNITWRQQAGAHVYEAQAAAGHARPSTTWDYTHCDPVREKEHVSVILDRLGMGKATVQ